MDVRHDGDKKEWGAIVRFGIQTTTKMKLAFTEEGRLGGGERQSGVGVKGHEFSLRYFKSEMF